MTDDEIPESIVAAARDQGASEGFLAYVREYPESDQAEHLRMCVRNDWDIVANGGSFTRNLFQHGPEVALSNADYSNARRIADLFPELEDHHNVPDAETVEEVEDARAD